MGYFTQSVCAGKEVCWLTWSLLATVLVDIATIVLELLVFLVLSSSV